MVNSFITKNMVDTDYRPEQIFARDYIAEKYPDWIQKLEYKMYNLTLDDVKYRNCILDIAITNKKIAIRLNGGYHFSSGRQELKDELQKEALKQDGWRVVDFDHYKMPNLFKKKKNEETIKLAREEVDKYLG